MSGKPMVLLLLAVVSGLGAMFGTSRLLSKTQKKAVVETQDVLVAARDLKEEEMLKPELVKTIKMARSDLPAGTFTTFKDVEDRWLFIKTLEGEPILDRKLAPKGTPPGLLPRIPVGMRAFTIDVNESTGVSGFVLPNHRVDVIQVIPGPEGKSAAETLLQDVLVLASGQVFTRPEDRSIQSRTVTLAVAPDQVDTLVAARSRGPLSLSLRGLNDHQQVAFKKPEPPKPPAPAAAPAPVPAPVPVAVAPPAPPAPPPPAPAADELALKITKPRVVTIYRGHPAMDHELDKHKRKENLDEPSRATGRITDSGQRPHKQEVPLFGPPGDGPGPGEDTFTPDPTPGR